MKIKQIIIVITTEENHARVVYGPDGEVLDGDEGYAVMLGSVPRHRRSINIIGTEHESISVSSFVRVQDGVGTIVATLLDIWPRIVEQVDALLACLSQSLPN